MTPYAICFYFLSFFIIVATVLAISCRNMVHAILYLVGSFIATAMMFYLLGAPLLAAFEVIIYAGGIMVLFLFIIMMLSITETQEPQRRVRRYSMAGVIGVVYLIACRLLMQLPATEANTAMRAAGANPADFGVFVFRQHWLSIEIISLLLLIVLMGVMILGITIPKKLPDRKEAS